MTKGTVRIGGETDTPGSPEARAVDREATEALRAAGNTEPTAMPAVDSGDSVPKDLPKAKDDRSAPKGNITAGQSDRNPDIQARDDFQPPRPKPETAIAAGHRAAERPRAAASRAAATRKKSPPASAGARRGKAKPLQAPKDSERNAKRAAAERKPGVGRRGSAGTPNRKRTAPRAKRSEPPKPTKKSQPPAQDRQGGRPGKKPAGSGGAGAQSGSTGRQGKRSPK